MCYDAAANEWVLTLGSGATVRFPGPDSPATRRLEGGSLLVAWRPAGSRESPPPVLFVIERGCRG